MTRNKPPAYLLHKNGGKTGRAWHGCAKDYFGAVAIDPRITGEGLCLHPKSDKGKRKLERLQTITGNMPPARRRHRYTRKAKWIFDKA